MAKKTVKLLHHTSFYVYNKKSKIKINSLTESNSYNGRKQMIKKNGKKE